MRGARRRLGEAGSVAAEFAVTLPALLAVIVLGLIALGAGGQAVRLQDGAADAARLIARGEPENEAARVAARAGADQFTVTRDGDMVCVDLAGGARLDMITLVADALRVSAHSCALEGGW